MFGLLFVECGMFGEFCGFRFGVDLRLLCLGWFAVVMFGLVGFVAMALMSLRFWVSVWVRIGGFSGWRDILSGVDWRFGRRYFGWLIVVLFGFRVGGRVWLVCLNCAILVVTVMVFLLLWLRGVVLCWRIRLGLVVFCGLL